MVKGVYLTYNQSPLVKLLDFEMFTSCHFFLLLSSCNVWFLWSQKYLYPLENVIWKENSNQTPFLPLGKAQNQKHPGRGIRWFLKKYALIVRMKLNQGLLILHCFQLSTTALHSQVCLPKHCRPVEIKSHLFKLLTPKIWLLILPSGCYTFPCQ